MKHHLIASLEWRAVCLRSVGVRLMFMGDFLEKTSMPYEICKEWGGVL